MGSRPLLATAPGFVRLDTPCSYWHMLAYSYVLLLITMSVADLARAGLLAAALAARRNVWGFGRVDPRVDCRVCRPRPAGPPGLAWALRGAPRSPPSRPPAALGPPPGGSSPPVPPSPSPPCTSPPAPSGSALGGRAAARHRGSACAGWPLAARTPARASRNRSLAPHGKL